MSHLLEVAHSALLIGCCVQEKLIQFVEAHTVHIDEKVSKWPTLYYRYVNERLLFLMLWAVLRFAPMKTVIGPHESLNDTPVQIGVP